MNDDLIKEYLKEISAEARKGLEADKMYETFPGKTGHMSASLIAILAKSDAVLSVFFGEGEEYDKTSNK